MDDVILKFLVVEADGEAVLKYPINANNINNMEMIEAVLASNPVLRLVDSVEVGDIWNGTRYSNP
jgi:hypothetical protein